MFPFRRYLLLLRLWEYLSHRPAWSTSHHRTLPCQELPPAALLAPELRGVSKWFLHSYRDSSILSEQKSQQQVPLCWWGDPFQAQLICFALRLWTSHRRAWNQQVLLNSWTLGNQAVGTQSKYSGEKKKKKKDILTFVDPNFTKVAGGWSMWPPVLGLGSLGYKGLPVDQTTIQQAVSQNTSTENNLNIIEIFLVFSEIFSKNLNVSICHTRYSSHKRLVGMIMKHWVWALWMQHVQAAHRLG